MSKIKAASTELSDPKFDKKADKKVEKKTDIKSPEAAAKAPKAKATKPKVAKDSASPLATASVAIIRDGVVVSRDDRVRHAAYLLAEARGFEPGHEVEDWLAAEASVDEKPAG